MKSQFVYKLLGHVTKAAIIEVFPDHQKTTALAASICLQHCEGPKFLPSPRLPYSPVPFPSLFSPPLPLEVGSLNPARGSGGALVHFQGEGTLLVAFKMHGLKRQKRPFFTLARLLWGSKP